MLAGTSSGEWEEEKYSRWGKKGGLGQSLRDRRLFSAAQPINESLTTSHCHCSRRPRQPSRLSLPSPRQPLTILGQKYNVVRWQRAPLCPENTQISCP